MTFFFMDSVGIGFISFLLVVIMLAIYLVPTMVAVNNKEASQKWAAIIVNIAFGWTLVGWVIALILAFQKRQTVVVQQIVQHAAPATATAPEANTAKR